MSRRVIVTEYLSLDGVIEDPGGAEQFEQAASGHGIIAFERCHIGVVGEHEQAKFQRVSLRLRQGGVKRRARRIQHRPAGTSARTRIGAVGATVPQRPQMGSVSAGELATTRQPGQYQETGGTGGVVFVEVVLALLAVVGRAG
jgi:hypothetical protein